MRIAFLIAGFVCVAAASILPASPSFAAQDLAVDLASDHVDITTGFNGSNLVLFGTRKPGADVVVVVEGPRKNIAVRRKSNVLGVWMNTSFEKFEDVPVFYSHAVGRDADKKSKDSALVIPEKLAEKHNIGPKNIIARPDDMSEKKFETFRAALIRTQQEAGMFAKGASQIDFLSDRLFRTTIYMPANVPQGQYTVMTYMVDGERVLESAQTRLKVEQIGFSAQLYKFAMSFSFAYAALCVALAVFAGWFMSVVRLNI